MTNHKIEDYVRLVKAVRLKTDDGADFIILDGKLDTSALSDTDGVLSRSELFKDTATTRAGLSSGLYLDGAKVFVKRTNNKDFKFTCKYLFRPARVFRAMLGAALLESLQIETPRVLACGEKRSFLRLDWGCIVTSTSPGITGVNKLVRTVPDVEKFTRRFLSYAGESLAVLHGAQAVHGDMKLCNFYFDPAKETFGIWDLDGIRRYALPLPFFVIEHELSHVTGSMPFIDGGEFFTTENLTSILLESYRSHISHSLMFRDKRVLSLAHERRMRTFKTGGVL